MLDKQELKKLYNNGLSMIEISEKKDWPYESVKYWMDKYNIPKRSRTELCYRGYWRTKKKFIEFPEELKFGRELKIEKVKDLYYNKGLSAREVGECHKRSINSIYRFMRKHNLERRAPFETNRIAYLKQPLSYKIKQNLTTKQEKLKIAGIMLYWAEGAKLNLNNRNYTIDFANSNTEMVKLFVNFLRTICGIDENRLRLHLYCYGDQDIERLKRYWSRITKISKNKFIKPYVRNDFKKEKSGKMKYGLIHIRYSDKKLFLQIQDWIKQYPDENR